jgi:hypothetical protein
MSIGVLDVPCCRTSELRHPQAASGRSLVRRGGLRMTAFLALGLVVVLPAWGKTWAQAWSGILEPDRAIEWSGAGVGTIPDRGTLCATLTPSASTAQINAALASCPAEKAVYLSPGIYAIDGNIRVPSHVTLRGAGPGRTVLNATGIGLGGGVVMLGSGSVPFRPIAITDGSASGSTRITLESGAGIMPGTYLAIAESNDPAYVSSGGSGGDCNWCDGGWTGNGSLARGQIVAVTAVSGASVTFTPGLYGSYTHSPVAVPFKMATSYAGVEELEVRANHTGYDADFALAACAYCWLEGVEANYTDGDFSTINWGYHDEIRDSYFSNSYTHTPGNHDSSIRLGVKTSASLIENNIFERGHESVILQWGAAGNVIAYNYGTSEFDSGSPDVVIGGIDFHGAHPQFNLIEGNVFTSIYADSIWGTSSQTTAFRNWVVGTNRICEPIQGRAGVTCGGANGWYGNQSARAMQISYLSTRNNFVGNVIGSRQMQSLVRSGKPLNQVVLIEYPALRPYDNAAYGWTFGYGSTNDDGTGSGCNGGIAPCHREGISNTSLLDGNYSNINQVTAWAGGKPHAIPATFYLAGKPGWWGAMRFPAVGPDVTGGTGPGGHSFGNPAQTCYDKVMGGSDGGAGGPLAFDPEACYGTGRP